MRIENVGRAIIMFSLTPTNKMEFGSVVTVDDYTSCISGEKGRLPRKRKGGKLIDNEISKGYSPITFTSPYHSDSEDDVVNIPNKVHIKKFKFSLPCSSKQCSNSDTASLSPTLFESSNDEKYASGSESEYDNSDESWSRNDWCIPESFTFDNPDEQPLYSGANVSVLSVVSILLSWFASYPGLSKQSFSHLLHLLNKVVLPSDNILPSSYTAAYSLIQHLVVNPTDYHACINDCVLFRNELKDSLQCPICGSNRYEKDSQTPCKRFKYLPMLPRVKQMFASSRVSQLLQSHSSILLTGESGFDIHHTDVWKSWYSVDGYFAGDARSLSFALCTDGLNPYAKEKSQYSMWPIMLNVLNYPAAIRSKAESLMLVGIIPGPKEPKNIDPYLEVFIDDLNDLSQNSVFDAYKNEYFTPRANIILHVLDYPGQNKVFHCNGAGAYAGCVYCRIKGEYSTSLQKMVYLGHRRFLNADDPLHEDNENFPNETDHRYPPAIKDMKFIEKYNEKYSKAETQVERKHVSQKSGCKGHYVLRSLPQHDRIKNTPIEPMHLIKNIAEHIVRLLSANVKTHKIRQEERIRGRFLSYWSSSDTQSLSHLPFCLSNDQIKCANSRAMSIRVPSALEWKPQDLFRSSHSLKSHEWKEIVCNGILKFCVRGFLGKQQQDSLFSLCDILNRLCSYDVMMTDELEADVHHALALIERDFPVSLNVIVFHLLHHLPYFIRRFGPVNNYWMYSFERFNSWISRRIKNRRFPESTVIETYRLYEWSNHLQSSGKLPPSFTSTFSLFEDNADFRTDKPVLTNLNEKEIDYLKQHYCQTIPEYNHLCERYNKERETARRKHVLRQFSKMNDWNPQSGPPLSEKERWMCFAPSEQIQIFNKYHHYTSLSRTTFSSEKVSTASACSSIVSIRSTVDSYVGSIQYLFSHNFCEDCYVFAYINWYGSVQRDVTSSLLYVYSNDSTDFNPIVPVSNLFGPHVTASDSTYPNKLWILNYK